MARFVSKIPLAMIARKVLAEISGDAKALREAKAEIHAEGRKQSNRAWAVNNRDKVNATNKRWRSADPERQLGYVRKWRSNNKEKLADKHLRKTFGITLSQKRTIISAQNGLCAVCKCKLGVGKAAHVDHCHKTNTIRGVLCSKCNQGLGLFQDSPSVLQSAIRYLKRKYGPVVK